MIRHSKISLHRFILSLSDALDNICPEIMDHQQRVAYIALNMARRMGFNRREISDLFLASALHDIGLIQVENRIKLLCDGDLEQVSWHAEMGSELLKGKELFARAAHVIRFHHTKWEHGAGLECAGWEVPFSSHIVHLADCVERMIDRGENVLEQAPGIVGRITGRSGRWFHPSCVTVFEDLARYERFWLDCVSRRIDRLLLHEMDEPMVDATNQTVQEIAEVFARLVDAVSPWTATHSAGVAGSAVALAEKLGFCERERRCMRTAGLLHDLGKLVIPAQILNYGGTFSGREWAMMKTHTYHTFRILETAGFPREIIEWASFHHEHMNGKGYPFHHSAKNLTLGSRIMAVADVSTALTEDRPYRESMSREEVVSAMSRMADQGNLDGDVVAVLDMHYDDIASMRRHEQESDARPQAKLLSLVSEEPVPATL